jgi:hypothetical protein
MGLEIGENGHKFPLVDKPLGLVYPQAAETIAAIPGTSSSCKEQGPILVLVD